MPSESPTSDDDDRSSGQLLHQLVATVDYQEKTILFGKYELGRLLGHGAFAKVYHARHLGSGESVAIKAVSKRRVIKSGHVENVKREISIMRRVRHPNVIRLREVLATKTKVFYVMEFAKGGELFSRVARGGRFGESLCRRYFRQLISALAHLHSLGVFHRDIKPENLLLDSEWNLKVTDFGLSAVARGPESVLQTLCGTPAYVAPEVLARKGYDGTASDVWSCGVVLFVLAAGYLPFNDANLMCMYRKIHRGEYRCPTWFSPDLKRLVSRLLDTNPDTRITIEEIYDDPWFRESGGCNSESYFGNHHHLLHVINGVGGEEYPTTTAAEEGGRCVNAFDIISHSSGFDLSGLFTNSGAEEAEAEAEEMFVSKNEAEKIIETVEEVARAAEGVAQVQPKRKDWWVRVEGVEGSFVIVVGVHRLTDELVVIEVMRRERAGCGVGPEFWEGKLKPRICDLSLS